MVLTRNRFNILLLAFVVVVASSVWILISGFVFPLHYAIDHDMPGLVAVLIKRGYKEEPRREINPALGCTTALQFAEYRGAKKIVDMLLDAGSDLQFALCRGAGAQEYGSDVLTAARDHTALLVHLIAERNVDPVIVERGKEPLAEAAQKGDAKALKALRARANSGYVVAELELVGMYKYGIGVRVDEKEASRWLRRIINDNDVETLERGDNKAFKKLLAKAEQGDPYAEFVLGRQYRLSTIDRRAWLLKAANHGFAKAQDAMGEEYRDGKGVRRSNGDALFWFMLAREASGGEDPFITNEVKDIEFKLNAAEVAAVKRRVEAWRPLGFAE